MDIEAAARAMFEVFHGRENRPRNWDAHPDNDNMEPGRDAFREMARAAAATAPEPVETAEPMPPPEATASAPPFDLAPL